MYLKEVSYIKGHYIHTAGPVAQLHVCTCTCIHVSVAGDLFWCKVRQECIMGRRVQLPIYIYMYAMELSKTTPPPCAFQNFHIMKFWDICTTILMSRTAIMDKCVEVTPHHHRRLQAPLKHKSTKRR